MKTIGLKIILHIVEVQAVHENKNETGRKKVM